MPQTALTTAAARLIAIFKATRAALDAWALADHKATLARGRKTMARAVMAWRGLVGKTILRNLTRALAGGTPAQMVDRMADWAELDRLSAEIFQPVLQSIFEASMRASKIEKGGKLPILAPATVNAYNWANLHVGKLVTLINGETKQAIQAFVMPAITQGTAGGVLARQIRPLIGLDAPRAASLAKYRAGLVDAGLSAEKIASKVDRMGAKLLRERSETIARTEAAYAKSEGTRLSHKGHGVTQLRWLAHPEACPMCVELNGQIFEIDAAEGMQPRHPRCSCGWVVADKGDLSPTATWPFVGGPPITVPHVPSPAPSPTPPEPGPPPMAEGGIESLTEAEIDSRLKTRVNALDVKGMTPEDALAAKRELLRICERYPTVNLAFFGTPEGAAAQVGLRDKNLIAGYLKKRPRVLGVHFPDSKAIAMRPTESSFGARVARRQTNDWMFETGWHHAADSTQMIRHELAHNISMTRMGNNALWRKEIDVLAREIGPTISAGRRKVFSDYALSFKRSAYHKYEEAWANLFSAYEGPKGLVPLTSTNRAQSVRLTEAEKTKVEAFMKKWVGFFSPNPGR